MAYFSEKLNEAKHKYFSYDKELYVVVQAIKNSGNHALEFINSHPKLNQRHVKWV